MGRTTRYRSASGGSFSDLNTTNNTTIISNMNPNEQFKSPRKVSIDMSATAAPGAAAPATNSSGGDASNNEDAARRLMEILLQMRDSRGRGLLHQVTDSHGCSSSSETNGLLRAAEALLERADQVNMLPEFLTQTDYESGYTPLHWAILHGSLSVILLLLRFAQDRCNERPMQLLLSSTNNANNNMDWEGLTPFRLLSQIQVKTLKRIRQVACSSRPKIARELASTYTGGRTRASSFSVHDNDDDDDDHDEPENEDDFSVLRQGLGALQASAHPGDDGFSSFSSHKSNTNGSKDKTSSPSAACEVMTFGAAHHAALGVSDTTKNAHHTNRPRRVTLDEHRRRTNPAVQVAAAAHHTLVLTKQGHVFACGLGKGGRLGTSGQEQSTPIPLRVRGSLAKRHVIFIAAAENHSLCVTKEGGHVFSWGSNRFGQLDGCCSSNGGGSSSGSNANNSSSSFRCLPHRVVDLKKPCVAVAAGERHSVALTSHGEVITWGDNAAGQLGRNNYNRKNGIDRVDALWSCERVAIQVAASAQSTLILIAPSPRKGLPVNQVYSWGHGNAVPIKVTFQVPNETKSSLGTSNDNKSYHHRHQSLQQVNPIDIACAKHHNVAATEDGKVFTWGLHAEPLASKQSSSSLVVASPVTAMLPENGGGLAVAVSASDQVTAVVTSEGHLYSWGCTNGKDVMGHEGLRWQPSPKRVPSVHRAVGLAIAKEHTVLLIGASYPAVPPPVFESNLESLAAREVCHHVDMFNVIPVCIMAERSQSRLLQDYCREFIRENLDVVLTFGRKSEMDVYLDEQLADSRVKLSRDAAVHPLVTEVVMAGKSSQEWLRSCQAIVDHLPISTLVRYQRRQKRRVSSFHESHFDHEDHQPQQKALQTGLHGCSERCLMLTANIGSLQTETDIKAKFECLSKEMRGIRKRLAQTNKLQLKETLTSDEREKLNRKPLLEADLAQLSPAMQKVEKLMSERNLDLVKIHAALPVDKNTKDVSPKDTSEAVAYLCAVCDISCPDANHLELHKSGRKHRNRMKQVEEEEEEKTAAFIAAQNQQQAFLAGATPPPAAMSKSISPWSTDTIQPRYQLTPPIAPPASKVVADKKTARLASHPVGDFRSILAEQGDGKPIGRKVPTSFKDQQKQTRTPKVPPNKSLLTPGPVAPLQNAPWAKSSVIQVSVAAKSPSKESVTVGNKRPLSSGKKQSLGSFLSDPSPSKASSPAAASWCASPVTKKVVPALPSPSLNSKSLLEIQQEEEAFVRRQAQHAAKEGKWYLERVDRANSLSAIQEAETEEQEMLILIEEQKQIEAQIARDHNQQKDSKKKNASIKKTKKRNCARNRSASHPQGNTKQKDAQYDTSKKGDDSAPSVTKQQQLPHQASRNHNAKKQGSKSQQHSSKQRNQKNVKKGTTNARKRAESHPAAATTITSPQK